jgi:ATP-dependent Clp protease protease subunit
VARVKRDDITHFMDEGLYLPTRTVYLGSTGSEDGSENGVDYHMAEKAIKAIHILDSSATDQPITIILNCLGGDVVHGMAIYDIIKHCRNHVTVKVYGHAMSMGSIILQAASERLLSENSLMMLHYGTNDLSGHKKDVERWVEWGKKNDSWDENMFLEKIKLVKPRFTLQQVQKLLEFDRILSAKEALDLGLIDGIITGYDKIIKR